MVTGADSIDDLDVIRHGGMPALFGGCYAPSTLGSFPREFTFGNVRQLGAAARKFLINLAAQTPLLPGVEAVTYVDVDSALRRVYGKAKQGAGLGHTKVGGYGVLLRGLSPLVATLSTPMACRPSVPARHPYLRPAHVVRTPTIPLVHVHSSDRWVLFCLKGRLSRPALNFVPVVLRGLTVKAVPAGPGALGVRA